MKYLTFEVNGPANGPVQKVGVMLCERHVLDVKAYAELVGELPPGYALDSMRQLIESGETVWLKVKQWAEQARLDVADLMPMENSPIYKLDELKLLAPIPNPNSLRDFITFEAHIKRGYEIRNKPFPQEWYERPVYYKGNHRTIFGPNDVISWPIYTEKLDYELEFACIVGKLGQDIEVKDASSHIFGFTILNDWSARDIQFKEMMCRLGPAKGKDFATSIGPFIVTPDEIPDVRNLAMRARVNGELWSEGNSGTSHWTWEEMIAYVSLGETIYPSDILGSGTVGGGCGYELGKWIQVGDEIELEVDGLGILKNKIAPPVNNMKPSLERTSIKQQKVGAKP